MKAVVVGSGGWGTALSMVLCDNGHDVTLWSHDPATLWCRLLRAAAS